MFRRSGLYRGHGTARAPQRCPGPAYLGGNLVCDVAGRGASSPEDWGGGSGGSPGQGGANSSEFSSLSHRLRHGYLVLHVQHTEDNPLQPGENTSQRPGPLSQYCPHLHSRSTPWYNTTLLCSLTFILIFLIEHAAHTKTENDKFVVEEWCRRDLCPVAKYVGPSLEETHSSENSLVYELYDGDETFLSKFIR